MSHHKGSREQVTPEGPVSVRGKKKNPTLHLLTVVLFPTVAASDFSVYDGRNHRNGGNAEVQVYRMFQGLQV